MERRYALFTGCSVPVRAPGYELSARAVAKTLGIELTDPPGLACCGYPLKPIDRETSLLMAARNLALVEKAGLDQVVTLCSACTGVLTAAAHKLVPGSEELARVNEGLAGIGQSYSGRVRVTHFARVLLEDVGPEEIARRADPAKVAGLPVAIHYGCHYYRPSELYEHRTSADDPENPVSLHRLLRAVGADIVDYARPDLCCGGGALGVDEPLALDLAGAKLRAVTEAGGQSLVVACPFCAVMYGSSQKKIEKRQERTYNLPVIFYTQVLGLALGLDEDELGFDSNPVRSPGIAGHFSGEPGPRRAGEAAQAVAAPANAREEGVA